MRVASTLVAKFSFIELWLCSAFALADVSEFSVPIALVLVLRIGMFTSKGTIKLLSIRDIQMDFR